MLVLRRPLRGLYYLINHHMWHWSITGSKGCLCHRQSKSWVLSDRSGCNAGCIKRLACVASVSVWFRSKETPTKGTFGFDRTRNETRAKKWKRGKVCFILRGHVWYVTCVLISCGYSVIVYSGRKDLPSNARAFSLTSFETQISSCDFIRVSGRLISLLDLNN